MSLFRFCVLRSLVLICSLSWCKAAYAEECPPVEDAYPCYCEEEDEITVMYCNHLNESSQIKGALSSLNEYKIFKLSFYKFHFDSIKSDAFRGPAINQIIFTNSSLKMEQPQFLGLETSLTRLTFLSCFNQESPFISWSLSHLEKLRDLTFDRNSIPILKETWLTSTPANLRSLTFSECSIAELGKNVFAKLSNLANIFLNDNGISSVSRSMFPNPAENLRTINLDDNNLETLPDNMFEEMPSLKTVGLGNNKLKSLSESLWSPIIESLSNVHLEGPQH
ncbi:oplophorus-luciferin 2-monooxygenase non-catalytic subunit-like [Uloborus diversus]|uniref:oplophorus-luciferin 2-monooxygenase non-catalytic subunit-like n=1 Tax=Uloborus diversus TaxID=327109 RepID=UPI00240A0D70|nr:oplophorus-luciferin 2-monooxygenase non-catalytic subunit-like [Uloborus diversus]